MAFPPPPWLSPDIRAARRAAMSAAVDERAERRMREILAEELDFEMSVSMGNEGRRLLESTVPPDSAWQPPEASDLHGLRLEHLAREAPFDDTGDDYAGTDPWWQFKLIAGFVVAVLGIGFLAGCAVLLLALVNWGR